jgi:SAM-dependent methyltransferase
LGVKLGKRGHYLRAKALIDRQFDQRLGTDTGGVQNLYSLTIVGANALHGGTHIAVDPADFVAGIAALGIDPSAFTFVDLGSGKGRALLLAAQCGFRHIIGVEFALELHKVAIANVAAFGAQHPNLAARIQLVHADATTFAPPLTPLVIFLCNPFDAVICGQVARNIMDSWRAVPRPIHTFYMHAVEADAWIEAGWRVTTRARPYAVLEPAASPNGTNGGAIRPPLAGKASESLA